MGWIRFFTNRTIREAPITRIYLQCRRLRFDSWVRKIPWRREWQPTPVFWPGESIPWRKEPGRLQTMGSQRVRHDCVTNTHFSSFHYKENNTGTARWKRCIGQGMRGGDAQLSYLLQAPRLTCQGLQVFTVLPLITFDFLVTNSHPEATQEPHPESPL